MKTAATTIGFLLTALSPLAHAEGQTVASLDAPAPQMEKPEQHSSVDEVEAKRLRVAERLFMANFNRDIRTQFRKRCRVKAELESLTDFAILLDKKSKKKNKLFTRNTPAGDRITVHCNGFVKVVDTEGATRRVRPKLRLRANRQILHESCLHYCLDSHPSCADVELSSDSAASITCNSACKSECR